MHVPAEFMQQFLAMLKREARPATQQLDPGAGIAANLHDDLAAHIDEQCKEIDRVAAEQLHNFTLERETKRKQQEQQQL